MDVDPRLQNLGPVDIHDFQFGPTAGFDPNYPAAVYGHGLNGNQNVHPHAPTHFVQDGQGGYFNAPAPQQQPQPPPPQQQQTQQAQRQQRRANTQRGRLQTQQNLNVNTSIDPSLGNGNAAGNNVQARRNRMATHPATRPQQRVLPHSQYMGQFASPPSIQQASPGQQSPTIRQQANPVPTATPTSSTRPTQSTIQTQFTPTQAAQVPVQTPTSVGQTPTNSDQLTAFNPPSTFDFVPNPPNLAEWRQRFFNITGPIFLTSEQYHTYFPHVDNIYSHRSTQRYKKKPFVSHYWDCRLKGRPTGTPMSKSKAGSNAANNEGDDQGDAQEEAKEKKKRKRKTRERDLCDVKIKVTEFFGRDELEALGRLGISEDDAGDGLMGVGGLSSGSGTTGAANGQLTFVLEDGTTASAPPDGSGLQGSGGGLNTEANMPFGVLEPLKRFPTGHPGAEGKRWYMVQRVNGSGKDGEAGPEGGNLDHKHTLEESDRIKKNSVQRWLLTQEKEKKKQAQRSKNPTSTDQAETSPKATTRQPSTTNSNSYFASGEARQTAKLHAAPASSQITLYAGGFCPFAQRVWIALELKQIPYQLIEIQPTMVKDGRCILPNMLEFNPEGAIPCVRHGNWAVWESGVIMEYLEDLSMGHSLLPLGNPQLRAHCRLWTDHINRKILPFFYALLLQPQNSTQPPGGGEFARATTEQRSSLVNSLQTAITDLVNASHATGPYFLGTEMSFVDVAFAPWIIRLSRVLSFYRDFPRPEVGTRWYTWVNAIEEHECVKRTVSEDRSYQHVYGGVGREGFESMALSTQHRNFAEISYARKLVLETGFGLGGDVLGHLFNKEKSGGLS